MEFTSEELTIIECALRLYYVRIDNPVLEAKTKSLIFKVTKTEE